MPHPKDKQHEGVKVTCPECSFAYSYRAIKRHLVSEHDYHYTEESPNIPVKIEKL